MTMTVVLRVILVFVCVGNIACLLDGLPTSEATRISILETKVGQLEATLNQVNAKLAQLSIPTPTVAFTAVLGSTITNLGSHQIVVFDQLVTNDGAAYNHLDGHFTAPVDGAYAFYVTATNIPHHSVSLYLMKNGQAMNARVYAHGSAGDSGLYVTSTIATVLHLHKGDRVWVQNEYDTGGVEELDGGWSFFSGHLIK